jgi:hypothetical protein
MAFTWQSAGHAFASLFKDVVTVSKKVVSALGGIQNEEKLIESLTSLVSPQAAAVEQIALARWANWSRPCRRRRPPPARTAST